MCARNRDDFTEAVKTRLAKRAAYICSNPQGRALLVGGAVEDSDKVVSLGIAAHITAAAPGGPRFEETLASTKRSLLANAIYLCPTCSILIDKNSGMDFPAEVLRTWKAEHEQWVQEMIARPRSAPGPATPLNAVERATRYLDLKAAFNRGLWPRVLELASGLEDQPGIQEWVRVAVVENAKLEVLAQEAIRAGDTGEPLRLIRAVRSMGANATESIHGHAIGAWKHITLQAPRPVRSEIDDRIGAITGLALLPDQGEIAASTDNALVLFHSTRTGRQTGTHRAYVSSQIVVPAPEPNRVLVKGSAANVELREREPRYFTTVCTYPGNGSVTALAVSPAGNFVAGGYQDGIIRIWDYQSGRPIREYTGHTGSAVNALAISPDDKYVFSGGDDGTVHVWAGPLDEASVSDPRTGSSMEQALHTFSGYRPGVAALAVTAEGRYLIVAGRNATLKLLSLGEGTLMHDFGGCRQQITSLAITPDGYEVLAGTESGQLIVWNIASGKEVRVLELPYHRGGRMRILGMPAALTAVTVSPDGMQIACGTSSGEVWFWECPRGLFSAVGP